MLLLMIFLLYFSLIYTIFLMPQKKKFHRNLDVCLSPQPCLVRSQSTINVTQQPLILLVPVGQKCKNCMTKRYESSHVTARLKSNLCHSLHMFKNKKYMSMIKNMLHFNFCFYQKSKKSIFNKNLYYWQQNTSVCFHKIE